MIYAVIGIGLVGYTLIVSGLTARWCHRRWNREPSQAPEPYDVKPVRYLDEDGLYRVTLEPGLPWVMSLPQGRTGLGYRPRHAWDQDDTCEFPIIITEARTNHASEAVVAEGKPRRLLRDPQEISVRRQSYSEEGGQDQPAQWSYEHVQVPLSANDVARWTPFSRGHTGPGE